MSKVASKGRQLLQSWTLTWQAYWSGACFWVWPWAEPQVRLASLHDLSTALTKVQLHALS